MSNMNIDHCTTLIKGVENLHFIMTKMINDVDFAFYFRPREINRSFWCI